MKKFLLIFVSIIILLVIIDRTILKKNSGNNDSIQSAKYERMENPESLPVGLKIEERAPSFSLMTLEGKEVTLEDFRGKKILLNFWATWCPPCKEEMPDMEALYEEYKEDDFVVLAVNVTITEKNREDVHKFAEEYKLSFPILMDESGKVASQYDILSYPTSYFIDSDGVVRAKIVGGIKKEVMYKEMILLP